MYVTPKWKIFFKNFQRTEQIKNNNWIIHNPKIFIKNVSEKKKEIIMYSNFNSKRINSLFSNLSSLSFLELIELKKNYNSLNYSTIDIDVQIQKIIL